MRIKKYLIGILIIASLPLAAQYKFQGQIVDANTREGIIGATVLKAGTQNGTITDIHSEFYLESDQETIQISISFLGYEKKTVEISSKDEKTLIELKPTVYEIEQFIVSATREKDKRNDAPISLSIIKPTQINEIKAENASQILNKVASVHVADFGNEQQSISIRQPLSFSRTQLVILEDGVPIAPTAITSSGDIKEVNLEGVRLMEVLRGPTSSIYGSEAIGGVVNFISKRPSLTPTAKLSYQGSQYGYTKLGFGVSNTFNKLGVGIHGYYAQRRDGYREHSDFNKFSISGVLDYTLGSKTKWTTTFTALDYYTDFAGSLDSTEFYSDDRFNMHTFSNAKINSYRAKSTINHYWNDHSKSFLTLFYRNSITNQIPTYRIKSNNMYPNPSYFGEKTDEQYQSYGAIAQHKQSFKFLNTKVIAGASFDYTPLDYISNVITVDYDKESGRYMDYLEVDSFVQNFNSELFNTGAFINVELAPIKNLIVVGAIRYDRLFYKFNNNLEPSDASGAPSEDNSFSHFSPKFGITYTLPQNISIYSNFSVGFAPPLFTQLYKEVIVPHLKPATYTNYEIGSWMEIIKKRAYLDISLYRSNGVNEAVEVLQGNGSTQYMSVGKTQHTGIEYTLKYNIIEALYVRFIGTNVEHKFVEYDNGGQDYSGNIMNQAPSFIGNGAIGFKPQKFLKGFRIETEWQHIGPYFMDEANTSEYAGYSIYNLRAGYEWKGFEIWANALNITNELFASRASKAVYGSPYNPIVVYSYSPGFRRTIQFGLTYNFKTKSL